MINFTVYDGEGRILRYGVCNLDVLDKQADVNEYVLPVKAKSDTEQYILNGELVDRPENNINLSKLSVIADGLDTITLSGVTVNSTITIGSITQIATEDIIDFVFDIPGTYTIKVELFPYLPFEAVINAT